MVDEGKTVFENESTDFYDEFKDRMRQEPLKSVLSQQAQTSKPLGGIVTVLIGILLSVLVIWYIIGKYFMDSEEVSDIAPPVISANNEPVKVKPEDVGGMEIVGRDKSVYDRMNHNSEPMPERIIARQEEPVAVAKEEKEDIVVENKVVSAPIIERQGRPVMQEPSLPKVLEEVSVKKEIEIVKEVKVEPKKIEVAPTIKEVEIKKEEVLTVKPIYNAPKKVEEVKKQPVIAKDSWKIQVLSSRDKTAVEKSWNDIKAKHTDLLADVPYEIVSADLGDRGMFYRLRVGNFNAKTGADDLCNKLKARKLDCFVIK